MTGRARGERGAGLVEMIIAIIVVSLMLSAMVGVLIQQQRFYLVTGDAATTVNVLERLETSVKNDLMPLSPGASDVVFAGPDSIALRIFRGVYSICAKQAAINVLLTVRPLTPDAALQADSALVYSEGARPALADNYWERVNLTSVTAAACPDSTTGWTLVTPDLTGVLAQIPLGSPVRVYRHASYWLESEGGNWVLKSNAIDGTTMAVGGPLAPADADAATVLQFAYFDDEGIPTTILSDIARIDVETQVTGVVPTRRGGEPMQKGRTISVKLRNAAD